MASVAKLHLSGQTGGRNIKVVQTATAGTTVHATGTSSSILDEIWLWAQNSDTSTRKLTIEFGDVSSPDDLIEVDIPPESGPMLIIPGWLLSGTGAAARTVRAFAASANVVLLNGFVNRITP